jgi:hypothetical protein
VVDNCCKIENDEIVMAHAKLTKSHEQLKASYLKEHAKSPSSGGPREKEEWGHPCIGKS